MSCSKQQLQQLQEHEEEKEKEEEELKQQQERILQNIYYEQVEIDMQTQLQEQMQQRHQQEEERLRREEEQRREQERKEQHERKERWVLSISKKKKVAYDQFMYGKKDSMVLRSGKTLSGFNNSQMYKDIKALLKGDNTKDVPHHGYCTICFTLFSLFEFLETHHEELRGTKRKIHGRGLDFDQQRVNLYNIVKKKIEEFIAVIDSGECNNDTSCSCNEQNYRLGGLLMTNYELMQYLAEREEYASMVEYAGYHGSKREKYRLVHKNFFIVRLVANNDFYMTTYYQMKRDFGKVRAELLHWLAYFQQPHASVIKTTRRVLVADSELNDDCIGEVLKYII